MSGSHVCFGRPLHLEFFPKTTTIVLSPSVTSAGRSTGQVLHGLKKIKIKKYIGAALSFGDGEREQQCAEDKRLRYTFTPFTPMQRA